MDRRTVLTTGAAAAASAAAPQVFAQAPQAGAPPQGMPAGAKFGFYERGNVRIRYAEIGSGYPLLRMVALVACVPPALRALRVDPVDGLRAD